MQCNRTIIIKIGFLIVVCLLLGLVQAQDRGGSGPGAGGGQQRRIGADPVDDRVKFEYYARGTPGLCIHQLNPQQFSACSSDGQDYELAEIVPPKPEMRKDMKSGETIEEWIAFAVSQQDKGPLMTYSADQGGAIQHGGAKWFLLR